MLAAKRPDDAANRMLSLLVVLLLHALLLFAVLHFMVVTPKSTIRTTERLLEMIIDTRSKPKPAPAPAPSSHRAPSSPKPGGVFSGKLPFYVPPVAPPDVTGLGQALSDCAPENIPNLPPDQRAHCTALGGVTRPDDTQLAEPKSHVQDPARREAEMRAKNTPGRVPCTRVTEVQSLGHGSAVVPMLDPACAIGGLLHGFAPLNGLDK